MKRSFMKDLKLTIVYWMFTTKSRFMNPKLVYTTLKNYANQMIEIKNEILNQQKHKAITVFSKIRS